jgi:beta-N-acetylhexosaminidase
LLRRKTFLIIVITALLMLMGCQKNKEENVGFPNITPSQDIPGAHTGQDKGKQTEPSGQVQEGSQPDNNVKIPVDKISEQVKSMTMDEKIGQMVISGVDAYVNDEHSRELINKYHAGGFILLGQNVKDTNQVLNLLNSLKETNKKARNKIPLFLGVDQEGGRIDRMPPGFQKFPSYKAVGQINSSKLSNSIGKALAKEVKALGYNVDFAPVLDINSNPNNPVIGDRSFGSNSQIVTKLGIETMKGIRSENVIPAVKHFPGHGDTSVDSHTGLPVVNSDLTRLKSFELVPFAEAIKNNVDMIMVAHILFPKIDSQYPASMSKNIITNILRNDMKYNGIVITDDMTMGAILNKYDIGEAAVRSVNAGSDIILVCHDYNKEIRVITSLKAAVENGTIPQDTVDRSVYNILKLKQKYNLADENIKTVDVKSLNDFINSALNSR